MLIIVSHIAVSGCDVPNTRRVLRHTSLRVVSACRRSARVDFGSLDMVSALFLRMHDDLREAVTMLEDIERIARRVIGGVHPFTNEIEEHLPIARANLRARETPPGPGA